jgi:hypothetical protein
VAKSLPSDKQEVCVLTNREAGQQSYFSYG